MVFQPPPSTEQSNQAGRWLLPLHDALPTDLVRSTVVVHANVALATHGETVSRARSGRVGPGQPTSGSPCASDPLTQRAVDRRRPARPPRSRCGSTTSLVGGADPVRSRAVRHRAFARRVDEDGHTYIQFGDGVHGSRLPTGDARTCRLDIGRGIGVGGQRRGRPTRHAAGPTAGAQGGRPTRRPRPGAPTRSPRRPPATLDPPRGPDARPGGVGARLRGLRPLLRRGLQGTAPWCCRCGPVRRSWSPSRSGTTAPTPVGERTGGPAHVVP